MSWLLGEIDPETGKVTIADETPGMFALVTDVIHRHMRTRDWVFVVVVLAIMIRG